MRLWEDVSEESRDRNDDRSRPVPERFRSTLEAYEAAKRVRLAEEGSAPLRRELAKLVRSIDGDPDPQVQSGDVDIEFRKAKARVLQRLLAQHGDDEHG